MYSIVNNIEDKVVANLLSDVDLIYKVREIVAENGTSNFSVIGISDAKEYLEDYCEDLDLLDDSEVDRFLKDHGMEVGDNEPDDYVELIMDNHKCVEWKDKQYYLSESLDLSDDEKKIYDVLAYALHV